MNAPLDITDVSTDYARIADAIQFLETQMQDQPSLDALSAHLGLSPAHTQKLFKRWAGVSPKQFLKSVTHAHARKMLTDHETVLETSLAVGLSGPGRLHDLCLSVEAMTPGEVATGGAGLEMRYGFAPSPFGVCLAITTPRGLAGLGFADDGEQDALFADMRAAWPHADLIFDPKSIRPLINKIFGGKGGDLRLILKGTPFQLNVWQALLRIPAGRAVTYGDVAHAIGAPKAVRAVGTAIGRNPISYLIPCHRVLRTSAALGGYHWGLARKRAILAHESAPLIGEA